MASMGGGTVTFVIQNRNIFKFCKKNSLIYCGSSLPEGNGTRNKQKLNLFYGESFQIHPKNSKVLFAAEAIGGRERQSELGMGNPADKALWYYQKFQGDLMADCVPRFLFKILSIWQSLPIHVSIGKGHTPSKMLIWVHPPHTWSRSI